MTTIAFIGLGNMGGPMAANLVEAGHEVLGFDLVAALRESAAKDGVAIAASAVEAVSRADVAITMLPAIFQRTAETFLAAPTPMIAPVTVCVGDTGMPR